MTQSWSSIKASGTHLVCAVLVCALLTPTVALAARARTDTRSAETRSRAKVEADQARRAYDVGGFDEALVGYSEAYRLDPKPALLFNLAQCHRQLGHFKEASFHYRRFLALGKPNKKTKKLVLQLISEVEQAAADETSRKEAEDNARREKELEMARYAAARAEADARQSAATPTPPEDAPVDRAFTAAPADVAAPAAIASPPQAQAEQPTPLYKKWWLWTAVGVVVVGASAGAYVATAPKAAPTTLGSGSMR